MPDDPDPIDPEPIELPIDPKQELGEVPRDELLPTDQPVPEAPDDV